MPKTLQETVTAEALRAISELDVSELQSIVLLRGLLAQSILEGRNHCAFAGARGTYRRIGAPSRAEQQQQR